jgi:hypothetical protein
MSLSPFEYYLPTRIVFEAGESLDLRPHFQTYQKTLLIISETLHQQRPEIAASLAIDVSIYDKIGSNPTLQHLKEIPIPPDCTQVIGIGGGSKIDAAKALFARILTAEKTPLEDLIQFPEHIDACRPLRSRLNLLLVPTTFGASSEITKWATIWDWEVNKKYSISNELLYADTAFMHPQLSLTAPWDITAYTALDTLSHAIESIWSIHKTPVTCQHALNAIEICVKTLPLLLEDLGSLKYRTEMAKASMFAGLAFSQTRTAAAHALSYPLTLFHGIPHGYACSLTLGAIFDFNLSKDSGDLRKVLQLFQKYYGTVSSSFDECFSKFLERCKTPMTLGDFGVSISDIDRLVDHAFHPDRFNNMIHTLSKSQVRAVYKKIL